MNHRHQPQLHWRQVFTVEPLFSCMHCGEAIEPTRGWRRIRTSLNGLTLIVLLILIFGELDASAQGLIRIASSLLVLAAAYFALTIAILRTASYEAARSELVDLARPSEDEPEQEDLAAAVLTDPDALESDWEDLSDEERELADDELGNLYEEEEDDFDEFNEEEDDESDE